MQWHHHPRSARSARCRSPCSGKGTIAPSDQALRQAAQPTCCHHVGAILAKGSRVLVRSTNRYRNAPSIDFRYATFHADEILMRRVHLRRGSVIYVARIDKASAPQMIRPCPRCQQVLAVRGIDRAHYTTRAGPVPSSLPPPVSGPHGPSTAPGR
ncbi:hypothetical protein EYS09_05035 [Streptomyces kasugaensis]|uniref:CMP/dCMP-type deaminase domain-containing protein n=1 Tax=Streptomyces kasugaensis TaxID=1946 RepID=A0A4Q9I1F3_STRKA|nr:hypothetical protein EYS09_05035 [Streptomyces kasugaensis]